MKFQGILLLGIMISVAIQSKTKLGMIKKLWEAFKKPYLKKVLSLGLVGSAQNRHYILIYAFSVINTKNYIVVLLPF